MPRYKFRTLMIVLAVGPPTLALMATSEDFRNGLLLFGGPMVLRLSLVVAGATIAISGAVALASIFNRS